MTVFAPKGPGAALLCGAGVVRSRRREQIHVKGLMGQQHSGGDYQVYRLEKSKE
jgi:hypothetical protein